MRAKVAATVAKGGAGALAGRRTVEAAAHRLGDARLTSRAAGKAGEADDQEGRAPVEMAGDPAAEEDAERRADRNAEREEGERPRPLLLGVEIGDQRIGGRDAAGLADADAHPRQEQLPEILGEAAGGGEQAPQADRPGDDRDPAAAVGEPGDRDGEARIEEREGDPAHQPELLVAQPELRLDRHREDADDLAVDEVEDVGEEQDREDAAARPGPARCSPP